MFWLFLIVAIVSRSQIGRALADSIHDRGGGPFTLADLEATEGRLEERMLDLEERIEDTERMLQRQRGSAGLPPID